MKALSISVCAHLAVLWMMSQQGYVDYGSAISVTDRPSRSQPLAVRIIVREVVTRAAVRQVPPRRAPAPTTLPAVADKAPDLGETSAPDPRAVADQLASAYLLAGRLTRAPVPLEEIDLNATAMDEIAIPGRIEFIILIDENGSVAEVSIPDDPDGVSIFANRIAMRFRSVKFAPGELDGVKVKSRLQITVVSEPEPAPLRQ